MLFVRRYQNASKFLSEARQELEINELEHSCPLWYASALTTQETLENSYCGAVWNGTKLVFAVVVDQGMAFITLLLDETVEPQIPAKMLFDNLCSTHVVVKIISGESNLPLVINEAWPGRIDKSSKVWSYIFTRDDLSRLTDKNDNDFFLRQAAAVEFPLLLQWTAAFTSDASMVTTFDDDGNYFHCAEQIKEGNAYFWCHRDEGPVAMVWKRRPLRHGCSVAYVYTPPVHRGRGYGGSMVSAFTRLLLQDYIYTTLMVDSARDPQDNMYTRVGYRAVGERYQYVVSN